MFQCIVGSQILTNFCYRKVKYISLYILNFLCDGLSIRSLKIISMVVYLILILFSYLILFIIIIFKIIIYISILIILPYLIIFTPFNSKTVTQKFSVYKLMYFTFI